MLTDHGGRVDAVYSLRESGQLSARYSCTEELVRIWYSTVLAWSTIATAWAAPLTYDVGTIHLDAEGSMPDYIVTGSITTNGTIGQLGPSDILTWSLSVDGPRPYTFHPGNPGAHIEMVAVYASTTFLETSSPIGGIVFFANENTFLGWVALHGGSRVLYNYYDADENPSSVSAVADSASIGMLTIATRVPEPSAITMILLAGFALSIRSRIRARF